MSSSIPGSTSPFLDCIQCGYCCGYRRDGHFTGCSYAKDEVVPSGITTVETEEGPTIPVDDDGICIYLVKLNNGFVRCTIQDRKPVMCKLYCCLTEKKVRYLGGIVDELREKIQPNTCGITEKSLKERGDK